jgi:hypothetical protein
MSAFQSATFRLAAKLPISPVLYHRGQTNITSISISTTTGLPASEQGV